MPSPTKGSGHVVHVCEDAVMHLGNRLVEDILAHRELTVGLTDLVEEDLLLLAEVCDCLLTKEHGLEHLVLGDLLGTSLEHADEGGRASKLEIQVGVVALLVGGVDEQLVGVAVATDAHAGKRAFEGHATHGERGAGGHRADGVDGVALVCH